MWKPDETLCAACGLGEESHASGKCAHGGTAYIRTPLETHIHGVSDGGNETTVTWACRVCKGVQDSVVTLPVGPADPVLVCRWHECGTPHCLPF